MTPLLDVKNLRISFPMPKEKKVALEDVSFTLHRGETVGLVGESGSGKSVLAQSLLLPIGMIEAGEIWFEGEDLLKKSSKAMRKVRGKKIGIVFQDSLASLNPTMKIGHQIMEVLQEHESLTRKERRSRTIGLLQQVGLSPPELRFNQYPFEFSGGMRQRAMIAMAIACNPLLIIADEPTTALDVTVQAQIITLLRKIVADMGSSLLFITHDLGLIARMCDRVLVMQRGQLVEQGTVDKIFYKPSHPYTRHLLEKRRLF